MIMIMIVNLYSAQTSISWRILGQSLCQMINNGKHKQNIRPGDGWWCNHRFEKMSLEFPAKS